MLPLELIANFIVAGGSRRCRVQVLRVLQVICGKTHFNLISRAAAWLDCWLGGWSRSGGGLVAR